MRYKNLDLIVYALIILTFFLSSCSSNVSAKDERFKVDRANFKNGEIVTPDYVISDTLIVVDEKSLNVAIEGILNASDAKGFKVIAIKALAAIQ